MGYFLHEKNALRKVTLIAKRLFVSLMILGLFLLHLSKAIAAVYRTVFSGSERNLSYAAAGSTCCLKHFSFALNAVLSCVTASLASLGLVYKAFLCVEFLLACGEDKFISAFLTN